MDLLAHAAYGATLFSRTGLAGGLRGARPSRAHWFLDWTVWCAAAFGILPDVVSMGPRFLAFLAQGAQGNFFRDFGGDGIIVYRYMHSLLVALAIAGVIRWIYRPAFMPALAWPLHVVMDALTHGAGKWGSPLLYPVSEWSLDSVRWWQHPGLVLAYWLALPCIWLTLWGFRARNEHAN